MAEMPDIKQIRFDRDAILVEKRDNSLFYDVSPEDEKNRVDYYMLGTVPGQKKEYVLLKNAPQSVLERLQGSPVPIRAQRASEHEASLAMAHFRRGHEFGLRVVKGFEDMIGQWDGFPALDFYRPGALSIRYKDKSGRERLATLSIGTRFDKKGHPEYRIGELRLEADRVMIVVKKPNISVAQRNKILEIYRSLLKAYVEARKRDRPEGLPPKAD